MVDYIKHKKSTVLKGFYAMQKYAQGQELKYRDDAILGSYWSGISDGLEAVIQATERS